jgi:hypothetical protein
LSKKQKPNAERRAKRNPTTPLLSSPLLMHLMGRSECWPSAVAEVAIAAAEVAIAATEES